MKADPNRDYRAELMHELEGMDESLQRRVLWYVRWQLVREWARRLWLRLMWGGWSDHMR